MSEPGSPRDGLLAAPESQDSESGLHDGSNPGRSTDLSKGRAQTEQETPSAMQRLIGMLSSVKDRASGEDKARVIRSPSPVAHRLIKQLLVTLDEDAALSEDEGVCGKFSNTYNRHHMLPLLAVLLAAEDIKKKKKKAQAEASGHQPTTPPPDA